jgi:hypothetical protein
MVLPTWARVSTILGILGLAVTVAGRAQAPADARQAPADAPLAPADARRTPADAPQAPADARQTPADARQSPADAREDFICSSGLERRVISVFNGKAFTGVQSAGSCRVDYTFDGKTKTIWSSKTDPAYCTSKAAELITKLVRGNFSCKTEGAGLVGDAPPAQPPPVLHAPR